MKTIIGLLVLSMISATANAAVNSSASITNFNIALISGSAPAFNVASFKAGASATINDTELHDTYTEIPSSQILDASSSLDNSVNHALANTYMDWLKNDFSFYSETSSKAFGNTAQVTFSAAYARISFQYLANSVLYFSADAAASAFSNETEGSAGSFSTIQLYKGMDSVGYDFLNTDSYHDLTVSRSLGFSYSSDHDQTLTLFLQTGSNTVANVIPTPIPEPSSYALLLAGLGLVSCLAKRRKVM